MLARSGRLPPREEQFGFEVKWDGIRTLMFSDHGHVELRGRNGTDFTPRYPEVRDLGRALGSRRIVLDGEVVAFDEDGRPSFERLQSRMHLASDSAVRRRMRDIPATYVIFDLLYLDGHSAMRLPYEERRELLGGAGAERSGVAHARLPPRRGAGAARGHEGPRHRGHRRQEARLPVHAGRARLALDQGEERPHPGRRDRRLDDGRGRAQLEPRLTGGRSDGGRRAEVRREGGHRLHRADARARQARARSAAQRHARRSAAASRRRARSSWSRSLVAHVEFREWTRSGTLRAPSFKGLRPDVSPQECVREEGQEAPAG